LNIGKTEYMPGNRELFKKYLNPIFIETGSYYGDGIQQALDAGFKRVYSIESSEELYNECIRRFKSIRKVHLILGESQNILSKLLTRINNIATFWLDAHNETESPLLKELEVIKQHHIKTHTILIDDLRNWSIEKNGFDINVLKTAILEINPNYIFSFEDGYIPGSDVIGYEKDILIAKI
jgi:hypothetical protein